MLTEQKIWKEVTKSAPCPLCDRASWCYSSENGEAIVCGRTNPSDAPMGWKYVKDAADGRAIFTVEKEKRSNMAMKPKASQTPKKPLSHQNITLAKLPGPPNDRPLPKSNQIPQWLIAQGVPVQSTETRYQYSKTQWVSRFEWPDLNHPKGHDKTIRQGHLKNNGKQKWSKGEGEWLPYRMEEAIAYSKGKWLLAVEGEECVETARSLGLAAITWQGSSWGETVLASHLQQLKDEGILGIVKFRDNDEAGEEKAKKLSAPRMKISLPVIILDPTEIWPQMPEKGDIVDWVKWGKTQGMSDEDFIKRLEEQLKQSIESSESSEIPDDEKLDIPSVPDSFVPNVEYTQYVANILYGDRPWICVDNKLYAWAGKHYEYSSDVVETKRIRDLLNGLPVEIKGQIKYPYAKPSCVKSALEWIKMSVGVNPELVNPPGLNCTNGVLKISWLGNKPSWQLIDHDPSQYYLYEPTVTYDPDADPTACNQMLSALSPQQQTIFLRTIAASLDLRNVRRYKGREIRALLCKGDGNNGKDTLREAVRLLFGKVGLTGCTLSDFSQYDQGRKFPLAKLGRAKVNWASENSSFVSLDSIQSLKAAITGEPLSIEGKGRDEYELDILSVFLFNINELPRIKGVMEVIASRYAVLLFNKTYKVNADVAKGEIEADSRFKYDPEFLSLEVLPAFLNRLLCELKNLMEFGVDYSSTEKALLDIQCENSHLLQFSQDVGLNYLPNGEVTAGELWQQLEAWYLGNGTLTYEDSGNGKTKAIWLDQSKAWDKNVKGANQVVQRFLELYPKAKRDKRNNNQVVIRGLGFHQANPEHSQIHSQLHSLEPAPHSQHSQPSQFIVMEKKNDLINETPPPINQLKAINDVKIENAVQTSYVDHAEEAQTDVEQETEANSTGYEVTHEVAMLDDSTGYVEEYLTEPEEDEAEVLEIGDRIIEILSGIKGVVVGFRDGRVVFDCAEFGRCSRPAIMLQKI
jgi:putative DNA primase/helicase